MITEMLLGAITEFSSSTHATGATYIVDTLSKSRISASDCRTVANTDCSLRNAIADATPGHDTIQFRPDLAGVSVLDTMQGALVVDGGYSCGAGSVTAILVKTETVVPMSGLIDLANKGGPTRTQVLRSRSPAVNAMVNSCTRGDQRGIPRPQGAACDIGSCEMERFVYPMCYSNLLPTIDALPQQLLMHQVSTVPTGAPAPR